MRGQMGYFAHGTQTAALFEKVAAVAPDALACMHGGSWRGDGAALLRELSRRVTA